MQVTVPAPNISNKKEKLEKQKSGSQNSLPPKKVKCIEDNKEQRKNIRNILQREERIFFFLSNTLYHALACFLNNIITVFEKYNTLFQNEAPRIQNLKSDLESFFSRITLYL